MSDIKKIFSQAEITRDRIITGSDDEGEPIYSKKEINNWTVDVTKDLNLSIGIEAKSEDEARTKAYEWYKSEHKTQEA